MPALFRQVPPFARVSKDEYRNIRKYVENTARTTGFVYEDLWNLVIDTLEKRHNNVGHGKAKTLLTLQEAAEQVCKKAFKERAKMVKEQTGVEVPV